MEWLVKFISDIYLSITNGCEARFLDTNDFVFISNYKKRKHFELGDKESKRGYAIVLDKVKNRTIYYNSKCAEPMHLELYTITPVNKKLGKIDYVKNEHVLNPDALIQPVTPEINYNKCEYWCNSDEFHNINSNKIAQMLMLINEKKIIEYIFYCILIVTVLAFMNFMGIDYTSISVR